MILLGMDMGTRTACVCILEIRKKLITRQIKVNILKSEMVPVSITGLSKAERAKKHIFIGYFRSLLDRYSPYVVSPELFMARSFRSNLGMPISYLIGIMELECDNRGTKYEPEMPASWKRALEKQVQKVDKFYDMTYPIKQRLPNHAVDSFFLALFQHPQGFKCVSKKQLTRLINSLKDSFIFPPVLLNAGKKKRRKRKKKV